MKTFTNFFKVIVIVAVIGVGVFAPAKIYAQQKVENTKWARQQTGDDAQALRAMNIVHFVIYEFGQSDFIRYDLLWGLNNNARQIAIPAAGMVHNVPRKSFEGTFTQSGSTITLTYSDGGVETYNIDANGNFATPSGRTVYTKVPSLDVNDYPDSLKK